jgi:hypothetical protein
MESVCEKAHNIFGIAGVKKGTSFVILVVVHILQDQLRDLTYYRGIILRA